jgi:hypothetical protein
MKATKNATVILVHGAWADGSSWAQSSTRSQSKASVLYAHHCR